MDKLKEILKRFDDLGDLAALKRDGKDFSFSDIHHLLIASHDKLQQITQNPEFWDLLPQQVQQNAISPFDNIVNRAKEIKDFNPAQGATQQTRDSISSNIRSYYGQLYDPVFVPLDTYLLRKSLSAADVQALTQQARNVLDDINKKKARGDEILATIQETAAVGGTSKFAGIFAAEARSHKRYANGWLAAVVAIAAFMVWFLYDTFTKLTDALTNLTGGSDSLSIVLQLFFAKVLILSFMSVIFYQVVKNYNANMHLWVINKHRENSLKTFQAFVESTNDPKTKDIILVQSTQTIFAAGETGYVSAKDSTGPSFDAVKIIEASQK